MVAACDNSSDVIELCHLTMFVRLCQRVDAVFDKMQHVGLLLA